MASSKRPGIARNAARACFVTAKTLRHKVARVETVDLLVRILQNGDKGAKKDAARALGAFGADAKIALPALREAALARDCPIQAKAALKTIAPGTDTKDIQPAVDEDLGLGL
jgi:hypothetical protein